MHTAEAAAKAAAEAAAAPAAGPAAPGTFWQFFQKCSGPSSSGPSTPFRHALGTEDSFLKDLISTRSHFYKINLVEMRKR